MPVQTRTRIKQEPIKDNDMTAHQNQNENAHLTPQRSSFRNVSVQNLVSLHAQPGSMSGSTVRDEDVDIIDGQRNDAGGVEGAQSIAGSRDGASASTTTSGFGLHSRKLIKCIQKIGSLGIDATLPSLPKIVVVGDQSHGKSSIIEAACDISLPRSEGTCTRCPFLITTSGSNATTWKCRISIVYRYKYNPKARGTKFLFWEGLGSQTEVPFATVNDKSMLSRELRLAQIAILSPGRDPREILQANSPDTDTNTVINFSPNVISVTVEDPELPELSLYDLPGAIAVAENADEQHLPKFIEDLIKHYIMDVKATVLLAVSASSDTDTSTAFKLVTQCKALDRSVGVLTKPDLITKNSKQIQRLLNGEVFKLGHSWFVTKQLSQNELDTGVLHSEARMREKKFFATEGPWATVLAAFEARYGIPNLQDFMSQKLTEHILEILPEINRRVESRLQQVADELAEFPEQVKAPCLTVMNEIDRLHNAVVEQLQGSGLTNDYRNEYRSVLRDLRSELKAARPQVILMTPGYKPPAIQIESDSDDETPATPSKSRKGNDGRVIVTAGRSQSSPRIAIKTEEHGASAQNVYRLDQIKQILDSASNSGLPDEINPQVTEHLTLKGPRSWSALIKRSLTQIQDVTVAMLAKTVEEILATRRETQLFANTTDIIENLFVKQMDKQRDLIDTILSCEAHKPITYADAAFRNAKDAARDKLFQDRALQRVNEHFDRIDARNGKVETRPEVRKTKANDVNWMNANVGRDPYTRQIEAMAAPIGYYEIASNRVLDSTAIHLEYGLIHAIGINLKEKLRDGLQAMDTEHCVQLLAEDPRRELLRRQLIGEKDKLLQALSELQSLPALD